MTSNDSATGVYRSTADEQPVDRVAIQRARYLERTTDLNDEEALALGYREQGLAWEPIAWAMDSTEQTIARYMDRIVAQYGLEAIATKEPADRGDLEPVTEERLGLLSEGVLRQWLDHAARQPDWVPDEVDYLLETEHQPSRVTDSPTGGGGR